MRPPIKKTTYQKDQRVEVSMKEDGLHGSYFEAKVVSQLDNGLYVVKYDTLLEDQGTQFLNETVNPKDLRPQPPKISVKSFSVNQKVDAFDLDGWWYGVISGNDGADKYFVYFPIVIRRFLTMSLSLGFIKNGSMASGFSPRKFVLNFTFFFVF